MKAFGGILGALLLLFVITMVWGFWYTVDQNERGVKTRWGAIVDQNIEPGLHTKTPWVESIDTISIATQKTVYGGEAEDKMEAYSRDQQPAHFKISVNWHIPADKVGEVYWRYRNEQGIVDTLLDRHVPQQSKNVFGQYNAITLIQDRATFNKQVFEALTNSVADQPIVIESVQVEDVIFSVDYINAVKARMIAEVQVQQLKQQEEQQKVNADITVINAKAQGDSQRAMAQGDADAAIARAKGNAEATRLNGEAIANALSLKAKALAENPSLIGLASAEKWSGVLPTHMIPGGTIPFINVSPNEEK